MLQCIVSSAQMALPTTSFANARFPLSRPKPDFRLLRRLQPLSSPTLQCVSPVRHGVVAALGSQGSKRKSELFELELKVRDSELDQYGIVNNAIYATYCQHAFTELSRRYGIWPDATTHAGDAMAITESSFKYLRHLRVRIIGFSAARIFFEHFIFKLPNQEPVLEAKTTVVYLDKNYRPIRLRAEYKSILEQIVCIEDWGVKPVSL